MCLTCYFNNLRANQGAEGFLIPRALKKKPLEGQQQISKTWEKKTPKTKQSTLWRGRRGKLGGGHKFHNQII